MSQGYHHISVMAEEAVEMLGVVNGGVYLDATFGGGGHSERILERGGRVIALDLDDDAIKNSEGLKSRFGDRISVFKGNFKEAFKFCRMAGFERVDGVIADLGLSSHHLEGSGRGFSFARSEPLDMRFDKESGKTAYNLMSELSVEDIAYGLKIFADIKRDKKVAIYIKDYFLKGMPDDSSKFAEYIRKCRFLERSRRIDPATRIFMAIRMMVNNEVDNLTTFLSRLPMIVKDGTRVVVISFHSVEDRIVKNLFRKFVRQEVIETVAMKLKAELLIKKVITPSEMEIKNNPRSRSARMRALRFIEVK